MSHSISYRVTFHIDTKLTHEEASGLGESFAHAIDRELEMAGINPLAEYSIEGFDIEIAEEEGE